MSERVLFSGLHEPEVLRAAQQHRVEAQRVRYNRAVGRQGTRGEVPRAYVVLKKGAAAKEE